MNGRKRIRRLCCVCFAALLLWGVAAAESLSFESFESFEERFRRAADLFSQGDTAAAETEWTALRGGLRDGRNTPEETALLADTEYALGRIACLRGDYGAAYDLYGSAYVWYKNLFGSTDGRTLDARLRLIRLQAERLEMEEQALRETEDLLSVDVSSPYREIALVLSFEVRLRMNSLQGTQALLPSVQAIAGQEGEPAEETGSARAGAAPGRFRAGDPGRMAALVLADYYLDLDRPDEALSFAELALRLTEADPSARPEDRVGALIRAGFVQTYFRGEAEGRARIDQAVSLAEQAWRPGPDLANVFALAGEMYYGAGVYDRFYEYLSRALSMAEDTVGENHPLTADLCLLLSPWYRMTGDYRQALALCERSVRIQLSYLKDGTAMLGSSYNHLANCLADLGDGEGAAAALEKSIAVYRALDNGLQTAVAERNLALVLNNSLGRHEEALAHYDEAVRLALALPQDCHPETLAAVYMLAADLYRPEDPGYGRIGEYAEKAGQCLAGAASGVKMQLADYHYLLGRYLLEVGQAEEALGHLGETKALFETVYGDETAWPVNIYYDIADCLRQTGDGACAQWYRLAVSWAEKRIEALRAQGSGDVSYPLSTRDNALHFLGETEQPGGDP